MDEVRLACRRLTQQPGAAIASIVTLACAIGAAAATSSLLSSVLLRPLPVADPDRLVLVGERIVSGRNAGGLQDHHAYPVYPHVRDSGIFEAVAAGGSWRLLVSTGARPELTRVSFVSANFFDVLGVRMPIGRTFRSDEDRRGAPLVAVLSDRYRRRTFGDDAGVMGRVITLAGKPATVVGVTPRGFRGLDLADAPEVYLPFGTVADVGSPLTNFFGEANHPSSPTAWVTVIGRIGAGSNVVRAAAQLSILRPPPGQRRTPQYGLTGVNTAAVPAAARAGMVQFTRLLGITVGLLLSIGCATVGMLLLVRTEARREELAMCLALGASRARLARGVAIEGAMMALAGAIVAMPIANRLFAGLRTFQLPGGVDIDLLDLTVDARALAVAIGCALAATLVIALLAGVFGFSANIADALRSRSGATPRTTRRRTRTALVGGQVAVAVVLLAGAGLFERSLVAALSLNPGFDTSRILTGSVSLDSYGYTPARALTFYEDLDARLRPNPAIRLVSMAGPQSGMLGKLIVDGEARQVPSQVRFSPIDHRYFEVIGLHVIAGRNFSNDDTTRTPLVGIVSRSFGRWLAGGGDPIGHRITMPFRRLPAPAPVIDVVGVVPDVITNVNTLEPLALYLPLAQQDPATSRTIVLRAATDATSARRETLSAIRDVDPVITPAPMLTIDEAIGLQMSTQRFGVMVLGALGVIAALLTVLGTYVLAESMAVTRRREMGIRAALGATRRQLAAIVLAETGRLVGVGLVAGWLLAWSGAGLIRAFLFHVKPLDPATLAAVTVLMLLLACAVSLRPALHAADVDVCRMLKEE